MSSAYPLSKSKLRIYWYYRILARDKVCKICGAVGIDVHHIINRNYKGYSDDNLILLCAACHLLAEDHIFTIEYLQELIREHSN
jgi:hypothetical protein